MTTNLRQTILKKLEPGCTQIGLQLDQVDDHDNLIELGIMDSVGFLEFISELETELGISIDFSELDPSEFSTINGLEKHLSK
ncbi:MAG: acyl carrier protein [Planctomycetes bacterium]|nr:acyl carrier protein [Planctomycetota bacterium]